MGRVAGLWGTDTLLLQIASHWSFPTSHDSDNPAKCITLCSSACSGYVWPLTGSGYPKLGNGPSLVVLTRR